MTINSIKQKRGNTFQIESVVFTNFDANILDNLGKFRAKRAAWVLVGGRSSRMGTDKARAESAGRALALRVADAAAVVCGAVSLVGDPAKYADLGLPVVADRFPDQGPLAGIEAAVGTTTFDNNLIIACDIPAIAETLLEAMFAEVEEKGCDVAVPRHEDGRIEPLCSVYHRRCHPVILAALRAGIRKVTDGLRLLSDQGFAIRYVRVPDSASFANLNTPEDWRRYHHG